MTQYARQPNGRLHLIFTSMISWIADLPWEFAYDPERKNFLATSEVNFTRVAEGKGMKEVGFILNMSKRTANYHKYKMMKKLGATSTAELVRYAVRNYIAAA